jgi:hypothetical protein
MEDRLKRLAIVPLLLTTPAAAEIHVVDRVVDGDIIVLKGVNVRLLGRHVGNPGHTVQDWES